MVDGYLDWYLSLVDRVSILKVGREVTVGVSQSVSQQSGLAAGG